jgi:hypothetical protein
MALVNQIDQFLEFLRTPTLISVKDGIRCVRYRGSIGCMQVFEGLRI